jgi:pyruvate/2-oxoglutarate dehydrogenase complex dihydrolipoamide acyltransferase (E2) component
MSTDLVLPQLDGSEVTLEHFYVQVGETVEIGQPLAIVRNERFVWDIPATASGTLTDFVVQLGETAAVGTSLARVEEAESNQDVATTEPDPRATPVARKMAAVHGLDLTAISGSGDGGRITQADVMRLVDPVASITEQEEVSTATTTPQDTAIEDAQTNVESFATASAMHSFWLDQPYALAAIDVDLGQLLDLIGTYTPRTAKRAIALTPTAVVAAAVVITLNEHRALNSVWSEDGVILRAAIRLAIILGSDGNPTVVLLHDAAELNSVGIARRLTKMANAGYDGTSTQETLANATFSITALNKSTWSLGLLQPSCAAHLSIGAIKQQPCVLETQSGDMISLRPVSILTLAYDARSINQTQADAFLVALKRRLEQARLI